MARAISPDSLVGMVGGPLVWATHFLAVYVFTALACAFRFADREFLGTSVVTSLTAIATLLALAALAWLGRLAWGRYLGADGAGHARHRFFALVALLLCVLSAIGVAYAGLALLMLSPCR
jgi:hypothetical protein